MVKSRATFLSSRTANWRRGMTQLIPGEPEAATRADRVKNGVPLTEETWNFAATARSVGIDDAAVAKAIG
jgi:LDH2 family malate/lactate/ureidoglycolate dehydrogenase